MSFPSDLSRDIVADSPSGERIHSTFFFLGFPAQLKVGLEMIIQIMDFSFQVEIEEILVKEGEGIPFFHLVFRGYCRLKNEVSSSRFPKREIGWFPVKNQKNISPGSYIDLNSPLLLKPVYHYFSFEQVKKEFPAFTGRLIFIKKKET